MRTQLILGPPGTGKTTALLDIVDDCLKRGVHPDRIAYVSFTQKAAYEARDRAMERFNYAAGDFPYFRTLHSLASRIMGLGKDSFLYPSHYREIGEHSGITGLTGTKLDLSTTEVRMNNNGNHMLSVIDVARNRKMTVAEYKRSLPQYAWQYSLGRDGLLLDKLAIDLVSYKKVHGLYDFTDLITEVVNLEYPPLDVDVAIIDEAQDLTALQWDFVNWVFQDADQMYIAGDDDQAIYEWNGADIQQFLHLKGERRVLSKSWRLPRRMHMLADILSKRITERYDKGWTHNGDEGEVIKASGYKVPQILEGGNWMILARNKAHLIDVKKWLVNKGVPIRASDHDIIHKDHIAAIHSLVDLVSGKQISGIQANKMYEFLTGNKQVGYGGKARLRAIEDDAQLSFDDLKNDFALRINPDDPWWEILGEIKKEKREYYRRIKQQGESLKNPRVLLSTIHGVKGGEADNVLLLPDMARQTRKMFSAGARFRNEEHRVFYVGASRAKKRLYIAGQQGEFAYPFPQFKGPETKQKPRARRP